METAWHGSPHSGKGYSRLGDASNAAKRHYVASQGGRPNMIGWSALYRFEMRAGRWHWRPAAD